MRSPFDNARIGRATSDPRRGLRTSSAASEIVPRFRIVYRPRLKPICRVRTRPGLLADGVRRSSPSSPTPRTLRSRRHCSPPIQPATVPRYSNRTGKSCRIRFRTSHSTIPKSNPVTARQIIHRYSHRSPAILHTTARQLVS